MKQTAVEWLIQELKKAEYLGTFCTADAFPEEEQKMLLICEQAKEMERWQIMNAYDIGWLDCKNSDGKYLNDQYYFETFNTNEK